MHHSNTCEAVNIISHLFFPIHFGLNHRVYQVDSRSTSRKYLSFLLCVVAAWHCWPVHYHTALTPSASLYKYNTSCKYFCDNIIKVKFSFNLSNYILSAELFTGYIQNAKGPLGNQTDQWNSETVLVCVC